MKILRVWVAAWAMLVASGALAAERQWCDESVFPYDDSHALASAVLLPDVFDDIYGDNWRRGYFSLAERFDEFIDVNGLDTSDPNLEKFRDHLAVYLREPVPPIKTMEGSHREQTDRMSWDLGADDAGDARSIFIDCSVMAGDREAQAIAYFSDTMFEAGRAEQSKSVQIGASVVEEIYGTHRDRLFNGLPMWPQETWLNGMNIDFDTDTAERASDKQWIFLRPSIAPALRFSGTDNSELDAALVIEPFGFIRYRKDSEFRKWQGASLMVSVTGDNGVGYGALYRYGNWIIGAAYHSQTSDTMLYASVDLYDLIVPKDKRTANASEFMKGLGRHLLAKSDARPGE